MQLIIFIVESSTFYRGVTIIFPLKLCRIEKEFYFSWTSARVVPVVCTSSQNRNSSFNVSWINISHENKQMGTLSTFCRLIHLKKPLELLEMLSSDLPPGLSHLLAYLKCASEWYRWKRYLSHVCLTSFSRKLFYCFQQTGFHKRFSNRVRYVA